METFTARCLPVSPACFIRDFARGMASSKAKQQCVEYRLNALDAFRGKVLLVDIIRTRDAVWNERYVQHLKSCGRLVANLHVHPSTGVLLGGPAHAEIDRILVSEHASGIAARNALLNIDERVGPRNVGAGSFCLAGQRSAAFASLPTFKEYLPTVQPPLRQWSDCPFSNEPDARKSSWEALATEPDLHMLAFNLIRTPEPHKYKAYSSYFAHLPDEYGMGFVEAAGLQPHESIVACDAGFTQEAALSFDLMALVYFPSSSCFVNTWSDPKVAREAFPLRAEMRKGGFRHVWLRCTDAEPKSQPADEDRDLRPQPNVEFEGLGDLASSFIRRATAFAWTAASTVVSRLLRGRD